MTSKRAASHPIVTRVLSSHLNATVDVFKLGQSQQVCDVLGFGMCVLESWVGVVGLMGVCKSRGVFGGTGLEGGVWVFLLFVCREHGFDVTHDFMYTQQIIFS